MDSVLDALHEAAGVLHYRPMESSRELTGAIATTLKPFEQVVFAVLFGSAAEGRLRRDSDLDVAVYFESGGGLEVEEQREIPEETAVQLAVERATNRNVELLVLNRAPATVCAAALLDGTTLLVRDRSLYTRYFLAVTTVAMEFLEYEKDYRMVRSRSSSLSELDRARLARIIDFVLDELQDAAKFQEVTLHRYRSDRDLRRSLDRWTETLINAAIDIGKLILASEGRPVPQTYGQVLSELEALPEFSRLGGRLSPLVGLRNLLAHEYLDLRFGRIKAFTNEGAFAVKELAELVQNRI